MGMFGKSSGRQAEANSSITRRVTGALSVALALWGLSPSIASAQSLTVYSALDEDHVVELMDAFKALHPDIKVDVIVDSGGPTIARLLAEKENPRADILFGAPVSGLLVLNEAGVIAPYKPAGFDQIKPAFKDTENPEPLWVGMDAWASAVCFNTAEGKASGIDQPTSWADLIDPKFKGKIVATNPNASGTGFLTIAGLLNIFGEEEGWKYLDSLHENIAQYVSSGGRPCRMAAAGEALAGISYAFPGVSAKNEGAPVEVILPSEGLGSEIEAVSLIAGGPNPEQAKLLADFAAGQQAAEITSKYYVVVAREGVTAEIENYPPNEEELMVDLDFNWLAANKERILTEWTRRYGSKFVE